MTDGIFKISGLFGYARAAVVMSTQSETVFEWSVKLTANQYGNYRVGIASKLVPGDRNIFEYDEHAILYNDYKGISVGGNTIHSNPDGHKNGDVVHFRVQPQTKTFVVRLVRISKLSPTNFNVNLTLLRMNKNMILN